MFTLEDPYPIGFWLACVVFPTLWIALCWRLRRRRGPLMRLVVAPLYILATILALLPVAAAMSVYGPRPGGAGNVALILAVSPLTFFVYAPWFGVPPERWARWLGAWVAPVAAFHWRMMRCAL